MGGYLYIIAYRNKQIDRPKEEEKGEVVDVVLSDDMVAISTSSEIFVRSLATGTLLYSSPSSLPLGHSSLGISTNTLFAVVVSEVDLQIFTVALKKNPIEIATSPISIPLGVTPAKGQRPIVTGDGYPITFTLL